MRKSSDSKRQQAGCEIETVREMFRKILPVSSLIPGGAVIDNNDLFSNTVILMTVHSKKCQGKITSWKKVHNSQSISIRQRFERQT